MKFAVSVLMLSLLLAGCSAGPSAPGPAGELPAAVQNNRPGLAPTVVYESVELRHYEESGWPYLHSVWTNNTQKDIAEVEFCMLAFDKEGQPLQLQWQIMNSSDPVSYDCLHTSSVAIPAGQTHDPTGGWSLYDGELMDTWPQIGDGGPNRVAYALFCDKKITFSDGTVWENPGSLKPTGESPFPSKPPKAITPMSKSWRGRNIFNQ